ncbi:MAG: tetratricopeptide repeat protein [Chryseolinea sp.]
MRALFFAFGFSLLSLSLSAQKSESQKQDSIMRVNWESGLKKLSSNDYNGAALQFTQLINTGFSNKEVYAKRGVAYYMTKDYEKAKSDFDEAVKGRVEYSRIV